MKPYHMTSCLNGVNTNASLSFKLDDENRIVLKPIPGAVDCQEDYINACYIDVREQTHVLLTASVIILCHTIMIKQGYSTPDKFIATQGTYIMAKFLCCSYTQKSPP